MRSDGICWDLIGSGKVLLGFVGSFAILCDVIDLMGSGAIVNDSCGMLPTVLLRTLSGQCVAIPGRPRIAIHSIVEGSGPDSSGT